MPDSIKNLNTENETISATLPQEGEDLLIQQSKNTKKVEDLEVKDAQLIFQTVWHELEQELGAENLKFPAEIFWLNGAPGAERYTNGIHHGIP